MKPGTPGFVGKRLTEAREARGLTGVALADMVGVAKTTISQYENTDQTPRPEVMNRLTEVLNLPIDFFLRPPGNSRSGVFHYRSMAAATKGVRVRAQRRHEWLRDIVAWLNTMVELPTLDFPNFNMPSDPNLIDRGRIERAAIAARRHWSMGDGPIDRVVWLLENRGAVVSLSHFGSEELDAFSEHGTDGFEPFVSVSADRVVAARANFTAGHELGHLLLHRNIPENVANRPAEHKLMEQQANAFADAFLLPASSFSPQVRYPSLDVFRALKPKWRVSIGAMIMRCRDLELIDQEQYTKLWIAYSKRGWKHGEPLDETLLDGRPRVLRRAFELLINERVASREHIRSALPYAATDIENLCGLEEGYLSDSYGENMVRLPTREQARPQRPRPADVIAFTLDRNKSPTH
jgi:Zn-dependent peptidase ImmA (M78 family)/transcriptional regulator with XRE-family HTH domain